MNSTILRKLTGRAAELFVLAAATLTTACQGNVEKPEIAKVDIDPTQIVAAGSVYAQDVRVTCDRDWKVLPGQQVDWCRLSLSEGGAGTTSVTVDIDAQSSEEDDARVATFIFHSGAVSKVLTVIQSGKPVVTTAPASEIGTTMATLNGNWLFALDVKVLAVGFEYRKAGTSEWKQTAAPSDTPKGPFSLILTGLETTDYDEATDGGGVEYEYRAFVNTEEYGMRYGEAATFKTSPLPKLKTVAQIRALYVDAEVKIKPLKIQAVVLNDLAALNYPGSPMVLYVADQANADKPSGGIAVALASGSAFPETTGGSKVEIDLTNATLKRANVADGMSPVLTVAVDSAKVTVSGTQTVTPVEITASADLIKYESQLVTVLNTQLTPIYSNRDKFPTWYSTSYTTPLFMEIDGSETTYALGVRPTATFGGEATKNGSGTVTGIAGLHTDGTTPMVSPRNAADLSALTGERFESLLNFKMVSTSFSGTMTINEANNKCTVSVAYQNAEEGTVIAGPVSVAVSGDGAEGLSVDPLSDIALTAGNGTIKFTVKGTPTASGEVTFTVSGLDSYGLTGDKAVCTAEVGTGIPSGNFTGTWDPAGRNTGEGGGTPLSGVSDQPSVTVAPVTGVNIDGGGGGSVKNCWGGITKAGSYAEFSVTTTGTLSLYTINSVLKSSGITTTFSYKIGSGAFVDLKTEEAGTTVNSLVDLSAVEALQNLPSGTTVTFRLTPTAGKKWGFTALNVNGNVE